MFSNLSFLDYKRRWCSRVFFIFFYVFEFLQTHINTEIFKKMATAGDRMHCVKCGEARTTFKCDGCSQRFSFQHLAEHRQELITELDHIENDRNLFRQTLTDQINNPNKSSLIKKIDEWEKNAKEKIQQTANECRQLVVDHISGNTHQIEVDLTKLTDQLKQVRQEEDLNEIDLQRLREKLAELAEKLNKPANITIKHGSTALINQISVVVDLPGKYTTTLD